MGLNISLIIPTQGDQKKLLPCLRSLSRQDLEPSKYEVVLCLNNQVGQIPKILSNQKVIETAKGLNAARNSGMRASEGGLIFFLDDDCELTDSNHLQRILDFFERNPAVDGLGGEYSVGPSANVFESVYNKNSTAWVKSSVYYRSRTLFLLGGNFVFRRKLFFEGCSFDEEISWGGSELSFFISAAKFGAVLEYSSEFSVRHNCQLNIFSFFKKIHRQSLQTKKYMSLGLLPQQEQKVTPEIGSFSEKVVVLALKAIFMPDKLPLILAVLFLPFRFLPRKKINEMYSASMGYLSLLNYKRDD